MKRVRCYDNKGETYDRYTIIWLKRNEFGMYEVASSSANPSHPQGVWGTSELHSLPSHEDCGHFGVRISFNKLPEAVQRVARSYNG